jgi:hypothetical protein
MLSYTIVAYSRNKSVYVRYKEMNTRIHSAAINTLSSTAQDGHSGPNALFSDTKALQRTHYWTNTNVCANYLHYYARSQASVAVEINSSVSW